MLGSYWGYEQKKRGTKMMLVVMRATFKGAKRPGYLNVAGVPMLPVLKERSYCRLRWSCKPLVFIWDSFQLLLKGVVNTVRLKTGDSTNMSGDDQCRAQVCSRSWQLRMCNAGLLYGDHVALKQVQLILRTLTAMVHQLRGTVRNLGVNSLLVLRNDDGNEIVRDSRPYRKNPGWLLVMQEGLQIW